MKGVFRPGRCLALSGLALGSAFCLCAWTVMAAEGPKVARLARWTPQQAWEWYKRQPWLVGVNYLPSTACNTTDVLAGRVVR